ncbi:rhomboid family intramembrane serine protease [Mongoliitalea lutea]|uniref:Rhomboid family intramembrane serine protease n=1 Tax=Mongoliitalea lutea TaxID=849756 RepID=A0A8J3CWP8_9BACT|nr:rhomboid family intramembrane serine protease [Mongoliitalea lutea]GHB29372.1 rhomboid family intramembrane serine protease [Mongoliitalea lutea]
MKQLHSLIKSSIEVPLKLAFLMLVITLIQYSFVIDLGFLGIKPLSIKNLIGIIFAPLIHGSMGHFMSNAVPFIVLSSFLYLFYRKDADRILVFAYFIPSIIVWFSGRPYFHIGSSGIVYTLVFFIITAGILKFRLKYFLISLITLFFYGSLIYGVIPTERKISWEFHLSGAIVGIVTAFSVELKNKSKV